MLPHQCVGGCGPQAGQAIVIGPNPECGLWSAPQQQATAFTDGHLEGPHRVHTTFKSLPFHIGTELWRLQILLTSAVHTIFFKYFSITLLTYYISFSVPHSDLILHTLQYFSLIFL